MGANASKQQIGERVKSTKKELNETEKLTDEQYDRLCKTSPETLNDMIQSVEKSLSSYSPFPQNILLLAFKSDQDRIKKALCESTRKVLSSPIQREQYQWFMQYVFPSTVWFKKMENGENLYSEMMNIANSKQKKIVENMNAIYSHLQSHSKWKDIMEIENQTVISRQDDNAVALLRDSGICDVLEVKDSDDETDDIEALKNFIDNNLAVNMLMTTGKAIDSEFQKEMNTVLSRHGEFKPGPMKKVERALSKLENDYMDEEYPKAAKLLDIVRCSVSYNTVGQLLDGYKAFMDHIESGVSSLIMARVKNGFLDGDDGGYRDIKVNVVYQSTVNPKLKMICEVQFILNQYLYEKKRIHKLYSVAREQTYFDMVAMVENRGKKERDLKALRFEPILNVGDEVNLNYNGMHFRKCTIDSELGLIAINGGMVALSRLVFAIVIQEKILQLTNFYLTPSHDALTTSPHATGYMQSSPDTFFCVDMATKKLVFKHSSSGFYPHHWITINGTKYLSLQTANNILSMFRVSGNHNFVEDASKRIALDSNHDSYDVFADTINFIEYDQSFEHVIILKNSDILEKRALKNVNKVTMSLQLQFHIGNSTSKLLSVSNDGKFCVIGAASYSSFYLISLETQQQFKLKPANLTNTYAPCFINGDSQFVAVGGDQGEGVEIWSVADRKMVHHLDDSKHDNSVVTCLYSANGILAVGFYYMYPGSNASMKYLELYDVSSWDKLYRHELNMVPRSLFLTADCTYLAAGGTAHGPNCDKGVVFKIQ